MMLAPVAPRLHHTHSDSRPRGRPLSHSLSQQVSTPGLPLFLQANTAVQRQEAASLPPLTLPPLSPPQPFGAKKPGTGLLSNAPQLTLDPQIQLYLIEKLFAARLSPFALRAALRTALQNPSTQKPNLRLQGLDLPTPRPANLPAAAPGSPPRTTPPSPPTHQTEAPRPGEAGDVIDAATAAAEPVLAPLKAQLFSQLKQGWSGFSTVERVGVVSFGIGTVSLAGIGAFSNPGARSFLLDKLNGAVIPLPGASWLGLETHIDAEYLFFGAHLDVGRLLPEAMGFGPAEFNSITDPKPEHFPQRAASAPGLPSPPANTCARIGAAHASGTALPDTTRAQLETDLGADLSQVRVHSDSHADTLARDLAATAFTSGQHIFMRRGNYRPDTTDGLRLLAHEAAHTVQQANGPVGSVPVGGGVALSNRGDAYEMEADREADRVVTRARTDASMPAAPVDTTQASQISSGTSRQC